MKSGLKDFIRDYWPSVLAGFVGLGEFFINIAGVQNYNLLLTFVIAILLAIQFIKPQKELNKYKNSRPKIDAIKAYIKTDVQTTDFIHTNPYGDMKTDRYSGGTLPYTEYTEAVRTKYGDTDNIEIETARQTFALVDFVNNPATKIGAHNAERVVARINYYDEKGNNILGHEVKGKWSQNPEPSRIIVPQPAFIPAETDIPINGDERTLCIALKNRNEPEWYAFGINSYSNSILLKQPEMKLVAGTIKVEINLSGVYLDEIRFCFRLENPGQDENITITRIDCEEEKPTSEKGNLSSV